MSSLDRKVLKWIFYITVVLLLYILKIKLEEIANLRKFSSVLQLEQTNEKYAIVLDGGSTGTRIYIFNFSISTDGNIVLNRQIQESSIIRLSNLADHPRNATDVITHLLGNAKNTVPIEKWEETPVAFKGTEALRILPTSVSSSILAEVQKVLGTSSFSCRNKCVSLMNEDDEAIYGWHTLNFLLDRLIDFNHSAAFLEIGGGSLQVTFPLDDRNALKLSRSIKTSLPIVKKNPITIYTRSYSGSGLLDARLYFLLSLEINLELQNEVGQKWLISPCLQPFRTGFLHPKKVKYIIM